MVPRGRYFVEMSTLHAQRLIIKDNWFTESNCRLATISSQPTLQPTDRSNLMWPDPLHAGAYRFEIISGGMQGVRSVALSQTSTAKHVLHTTGGVKSISCLLLYNARYVIHS